MSSTLLQSKKKTYAVATKLQTTDAGIAVYCRELGINTPF